MIDPFVFDVRGYDVVRGAVEPEVVTAANAQIDALRIWDRVAAAATVGTGRWTRWDDDVVRFLCPIGPGHVQVGPVTQWPAAVGDLVHHPSVRVVLDRLFPDGHYVDHVVLSLARPGAPGIGLHGGGHERDLRQAYRFEHGRWDIGLSVLALHLTSHESREGGTALVPGSHKANLSPPTPLPAPQDLAGCAWVTGEGMAAGDLLAFPEALMHGAYPWQHDWERRTLIIKAYPRHLSNLHGTHRAPSEPFWPEAAPPG